MLEKTLITSLSTTSLNERLVYYLVSINIYIYRGRVLFGSLIHYIMQGKISLLHSNFAAKTASQIRGNALASEVPPQTSLGVLTALPQPP
jgi:hypothetical protein